jgi:putative SOS response-associated peptidase YedK
VGAVGSGACQHFDRISLDFAPRYNIAPMQEAPVVRERNGQRELAMLKWGLIPFRAKDAKIAYRTINACAETVATAPA